VAELEGHRQPRRQAAEEALEGPVVALPRRRELDQHGAEPRPERRQRLEEARQEGGAARGRGQRPYVGEAAVGLGGEAEALGRLLGPAGDDVLRMDLVVGRVDLAGREDRRVVGEEPLLGEALGVEVRPPLGVGPPGCANVQAHEPPN
jgi:hypothetical protein